MVGCLRERREQAQHEDGGYGCDFGRSVMHDESFYLNRRCFVSIDALQFDCLEVADLFAGLGLGPERQLAATFLELDYAEVQRSPDLS